MMLDSSRWMLYIIIGHYCVDNKLLYNCNFTNRYRRRYIFRS